MQRILLICCALLCCGFTIVTPEMMRSRKKLCSEIRRHYGEDKLTAFVKDVITKHPEIDGAKLADSKVGKKWVTMDWNPFWYLISEGWAFSVDEEKKGEAGFEKFTLLWVCDETHGIFVEGHREKTGALLFDSIRREELVQLNWQ